MECPKCNESNYCKDGFVNNKQRHLCKNCRYRWTVKRRSTQVSNAVKKQVLTLYLEGLGLRAIGRIVGFSNVSILNWIREFGKSITTLKSQNQVKIMEIDEMHSYIGSKKTLAGYGLLLIDLQKNSSILTLANEIQNQEKSYGTKSNP